MNLEILVRRASGNRIVDEHLKGTAEIRRFLALDPGDPDSYRLRAEDVDRRFDGRRKKLASVLRAPSRASEVARERVIGEGGLLVTTGHQAGLFGGPLMGFYKLLSAVRLARELEDVLGRPVVPAFWVASDDHDYDEVRRTWLLNPANELEEISLPAGNEGPAPPMSAMRLGSAVQDALAALEAALPETEFSAELLAATRAAYTPEATVASAFRTLVGDLAGRFGVLLVDPADEATRALSAPILARELAEAEHHEGLFAERSAELEEAGYHAQIPVIDGGTNVHWTEPEGRERIFRDGDAFRLRASGRRLGIGEVRDAAPGALTAGVGLRPILESAILPTVAYVGGPAEVAYFAQIAPLFEAHGIAAPIAVPRASVTLVESKVRKVLDRFDLSPADFDRPAHEIGARVLREDLPEPVRDALADVRAALGGGYAKLADAVRDLDPTLKGPIGSARNAALKAVADLEKRIAQHSDERRDIAMQQLRKAEVNLFPAGRPQERVLNPLQYLARYGPALFDDVLAATEPLVGAVAGGAG